jgi:hypothetical protein
MAQANEAGVALAPGLEPGMSVCRTDALAAWRSERILVHPGGLEPPCLAAAASEAAASAISPRVHCYEFIDGAATADRTLTFRLSKALPCRWAIAAEGSVWCWLEDSNLPPLAYEASALPDELSQRGKLTKGVRRRSRSGRDLVGAPRLGAASKSRRSQCQRARRHRRRSHRRTNSWDEDARARACALGTRVGFGCTSVSSAGHLPSCLSGGGGTLRRLLRSQPRALLGPIQRTGDAPIRQACAHELPTVRSIGPSGGGAERGGDM